MPTPVPLKILSRRDQRIRLVIVLLVALGVGMATRALRPLITGGVHYETLAAVILLSAACLVLLLGLRRIAYRRASAVFVIEGTALWLCFALGWVVVGQRLWMDLFAVTGMFWAFTVVPGLGVLWLIQRCWPPRRSMSCPRCDYDLRGLTDCTCPECGERFEATCAACGCALREARARPVSGLPVRLCAADCAGARTTPPVTPDTPRTALRRAALLAAIAVAGGVAMAAPAIHSEIDNTYPAGIRLLAGLIVGAIGAPMFAVVAWRKRVMPTAFSVFGPPLGAAVLSRIFWSDDYSLTHVAVPLSYLTTLVTFFVVPDRVAEPGRCPACGYDLPGPSGRAMPGVRRDPGSARASGSASLENVPAWRMARRRDGRVRHRPHGVHPGAAEPGVTGPTTPDGCTRTETGRRRERPPASGLESSRSFASSGAESSDQRLVRPEPVTKTHANRSPTMRSTIVSTIVALALHLSPVVASAADWPLYGHDHANSNFAPTGGALTAANIGYLRSAWETFNDDTLVSEPAPTGFVLEAALGLEFPAPVVGVIGSPIVRDETIYWVDELGTVFARDAETGLILDPWAHWTTTLVDPDFAAGDPPIAPELFYTAPIVTDEHVWLIGSVYGRVHVLERGGGTEIDFDPSTSEIDPFVLVPDRPVASVLGDPVIASIDGRALLVVSVNVIVNDAIFGQGETGLVIAFDVTDPVHPVEAWRTPTIDLDPDTGMPFGTGVSAGSGLALDLERRFIIGGTGQNTSAPYPGYPDPVEAPPGYIDRSDSIFAIDLDTGVFVWTNQLHEGDVFDLNDPVSTGPDNPDGPRDADVLAPPVLFSARVHGRQRDLVGAGSKGGLFRVVDRDTGKTVWERQISKRTGIGGIQGGAAVADDVIYVAGYEGIDDGFSDAQFGTSLDTGLYPNAFFATFSPAFWADVEDVSDDDDPATGMRVKVYALDAASGHPRWHFSHGRKYVELLAGASLRHVTATEDLVFVTTSSGRLFVLDAHDGAVLLVEQTPDLNDVFGLGLGKPHHAGMNGGTVIADGMVFVPYGGQNDPSGGIFAYEVNRRPSAADDVAIVPGGKAIVIDALVNDADPDGDRLRFARVAGADIDDADGVPDGVVRPYGTLVVFNPGDDPADPEAAYIRFMPSPNFHGRRRIPYTIEDLAPLRVLNGIVRDEPVPTHVPRRDSARISLRADR